MSGHIRHLSILHSPVFLINSRMGHFSASRLRGIPFSLSYGVILPSSLAMNHSSALGYSPQLPVSVYGTGTMLAFLGSPCPASLHPRARLNVLFRQYVAIWGLRHFYRMVSAGILTCYPSVTLFSLTLGSTNPPLTGMAEETLDIRRPWFSHGSRYSFQHTHLIPLHITSQ